MFSCDGSLWVKRNGSKALRIVCCVASESPGYIIAVGTQEKNKIAASTGFVLPGH